MSAEGGTAQGKKRQGVVFWDLHQDVHEPPGKTGQEGARAERQKLRVTMRGNSEVHAGQQACRLYIHNCIV